MGSPHPAGPNPASHATHICSIHKTKPWHSDLCIVFLASPSSNHSVARQHSTCDKVLSNNLQINTMTLYFRDTITSICMEFYTCPWMLYTFSLLVSGLTFRWTAHRKQELHCFKTSRVALPFIFFTEPSYTHCPCYTVVPYWVVVGMVPPVRTRKTRLELSHQVDPRAWGRKKEKPLSNIL